MKIAAFAFTMVFIWNKKLNQYAHSSVSQPHNWGFTTIDAFLDGSEGYAANI